MKQDFITLVAAVLCCSVVTSCVQVDCDSNVGSSMVEKYTETWSIDNPAGFPEFSEAEKVVLRRKGQAILNTIQSASAANQQKLVIPPGDYLFHADYSEASTLEDLDDIEIIADGVTFWFEPPMIHGLLFENCRNVTVRGLVIDFILPGWLQARITDIDRENKTLAATFIPGYEPLNDKGQLEKSGERKLIFYDKQGRFINNRHTRGNWTLSDDGKSVNYTGIGYAGIPDALKVGDYVVSPIQTGAALRSVECSAMVFEDVAVWSSPGMAVREGGGEGGHIYRRVRATRRPGTNRLQAFGADIFHLANTDKGPTLEQCEGAYGADDAVNIHGKFGRVVKGVDSKNYYLEGTYEVGDTIEFRDFTTINLLGKAKVISCKKVTDGPKLAINETYSAKGEWLVELDTSLRLKPLSFVVLDGKSSAAGFVIRDCWFHNDFQRTLINGSPDGIIENNTFENLGHGICVQFETWGPWMEGPFSRNLVIRNNKFIECSPKGATIQVEMHPIGGGTNSRRISAKPVTNMVITNNYFGRTETAPLIIHNVDGLVIEGNTVDYPADKPAVKGLANSSQYNWLYLQDCDNVSVD